MGVSCAPADFSSTALYRFAVVNVMERCRSQVVRVFNTDILVQKIHSVLEKSTDPVARSLALRAFASMAELLVNNQRVHSDVRNALRSPNAGEQAACTLCAQHLSEVSASFAQGSIGLLGRLILALETPMAQRLQLVNTLHHMHRDPASVLQSRAVLEEVMQRYPLAPIVEACLRTSASLAIRSRMRIDEQIQLLLATLQDDCRECVQLEAAKSLARILRSAPSSGSDALAMRMLDITSAASLRGDARGSGACFGILVMLARIGALSAESSVVVQRLSAMLSPPHPARSRKRATAVFAVVLETHLQCGAWSGPAASQGVNGFDGVGQEGAADGGVAVERFAIQLTESACSLLSETATLAPYDMQLVDAVLALLSLLHTPELARRGTADMMESAQAGPGVVSSGRKLLQSLRVALVKTRQADDPHGVVPVGLDRLNAACSALLPDTLVRLRGNCGCPPRPDRLQIGANEGVGEGGGGQITGARGQTNEACSTLWAVSMLSGVVFVVSACGSEFTCVFFSFLLLFTGGGAGGGGSDGA